MFLYGVGQFLFPYAFAWQLNFHVQLTLDGIYLLINVLSGTGGLYYFTTVLYHIAAVFANTFLAQAIAGLIYATLGLAFLLPTFIIRDILVSIALISNAILPIPLLLGSIGLGNAILIAQIGIVTRAITLINATTFIYASLTVLTVAFGPATQALTAIESIRVVNRAIARIVSTILFAIVVYALAYLLGMA